MDFTTIMWAIIVLGALAIVFGLILAVAAKVFEVEVDPRLPQIQAALAGAKILFVPAAWPHPRLAHWQILNRARAIENQLFVVAVNSCGTCGDYHFCGHSMIIDPWGEVLAEGGDGEVVVTGEIDLSVIDDIRSRINVFRDRRPELYRLEGKG